MKIDGNSILKKLKDEKSDLEKISMYLSKSLYEAFKQSCNQIPVSQVMEELMREFISSTRTQKKK